MLVQLFQIIQIFLYVCQSGSWHTSLLKSDKFRDISSSRWNMFLNFYGHIPWVFLHYFQIITIFWYICQAISWLTSLLKLCLYRVVSSSTWDTFYKFLGDIPWMFLHYFQINTKFLYVCQSVRWLTSLLKLDKYWDISSSVFCTYN